jgi:phosphoribosylanthranilate isomerase
LTIEAFSATVSATEVFIMVKIKVCGINNQADAESAVRLGADAVGFRVGERSILDPSIISAEAAAAIVAKLPLFCTPVLVTRQPLSDMTDAINVAGLARMIGAGAVQLQGETSLNGARLLVDRLGGAIKVIKSVQAYATEAYDEAMRYGCVVDSIFLDITDLAALGDRGHHDYRISRRIVEACRVPVFLSGGLDSEEVRDAIVFAKPYGIDVGGHVTCHDGSIGDDKLKDFCRTIKRLA